MGKDHELLEAARNGNVTIVEKILSQKIKRSGPLASLRRGPGVNFQDSGGYSALHHASLNGHADIVKLLLIHEASANIVDSRGASALHLAAWAGHTDIVNLLLTQPYNSANLNVQTIDNETPLHFAAQHGHDDVLTLLLAHGADAYVENCRGETPLDLASQYGRLRAVQLLLHARPELLRPYHSNGLVRRSPLHLASRNGHANVVEALLSAGFNVDLLTPAGTALHEASLCGKDHVVRTLLSAGADPDAMDAEGRTALDLLRQFPPHVTSGIISVINDFKNSITYESSDFDDERENQSAFLNSHSNGASPASPIYRTRMPRAHLKISPTPPKKPPRRNVSISPMSTSVDSASDYMFLSRRGSGHSNVEDYYVSRSASVDQYNTDTNFSLLRYLPTAINDVITPRTYNPNRRLRRSKELNKFLQITPLSPSQYQQPPTPEHPPPSAVQAEKSIHECIRPLSQEYKRRSIAKEFNEMGTSPPEKILNVHFAASSGSLSSSVSVSDRSGSTDCVDELIEDIPFAGLFKGSTTNLHEKPERPKTLHTSNNIPKINSYDHVAITQSATNNNDKAMLTLSPFDEQEEWSKITNIIASFQSGLNQDMTQNHNKDSEWVWLRNIGLEYLENVFKENGYDSITFINGILDMADLDAMNIPEDERTIILEAVKKLPEPPKPNTISNNNVLPKTVEEWLKSIQLDDYYLEIFRKHFYTDMERIIKVWEIELQTVLEINKIGHRKRILYSVIELQKLQNILLPSPSLEVIDELGGEIKCNAVKDKLQIDNEIVKTNTHIRHRKNRPAPKPPITAANIEIRAPSELLLGIPSGLRTQWRHSASILLTASIKYQAMYLGSTIVKELRGTESTRKSIQKLKQGGGCNLSVSKRPVCLAISFRGVQFFDVETHGAICEHEIRNINCACQDADDLSHFAYITKDMDSNAHYYCHVFHVDTMDLATEIILTLGQAFEVAYQLALRDSTPTTDNKTKWESNELN